MKDKKLIAILTLLCFMFTLMPVAAMAADTQDTVILKIGSTDVYKNGVKSTIDVAPTIVDGRTLVPVRVIMEALGGDVDWDETTRTVTININGKVLKLVIDKEIPGFGTGAMIIDSRTMVPIRYISEYAGAEVQWFESTQQIFVKSAAKEVKATYTVSFDLNTGSEGVYKTVTVEEGKTVEKPAVEYKSGRVFHGWYTNDEGKGDVFDFSTPIYSDLTLYGHWSTVSYGGGGSSTPSEPACTHENCVYESNSDGTHKVVCESCEEVLDAEEFCDTDNEAYTCECGYKEPADPWDGSQAKTWFDAEKAAAATAENPVTFEVATAEEFAGFINLANTNSFKNVTVKLTKDIDLAGTNWNEGGAIAAYGPAFNGTLDGNGHTISNLTASNNWTYANGLFRTIGNDATIKNLVIEGADINNGAASGNNKEYGILIGVVGSGTVTIENVTVRDSSVTAKTSAGILVGGMTEGAIYYKNVIIDNCKVNVTNATGVGAALLGDGWSHHDYDYAGVFTENVNVTNCTYTVNGTQQNELPLYNYVK